MNVLILGDGDSIWTIDFIKYCILPITEELTIYSGSPIEKYRDFYTEKKIKCYQLHKRLDKYLCRSRFTWLRYWVGKKTAKQFGKSKYDVIIVHFITLWNGYLASVLKKSTGAKIIFTYWGSDLLRIGPKRLKIMGLQLKNTDQVVHVSLRLQEKFKELYPWYDIEKVKTIWFGNSIIEEIGKLCGNSDKNNIKEQIRFEFGIPRDSVVIAIGYNGAKEQQHLAALDVLKEISSVYLNKVCLLFQMTYGGTNDYKDQVIEHVKDLGVNYKRFDHYLEDKEIAKIRLITDIFINGQTTDAFSGSVRENLYCGNIVLNAKWLHYPELDKFDLNYIEFEDFNKLNEIICNILTGEKKINTSVNSDRVLKFSSWEFTKAAWEKILMVNKG